ncbi:acyl carrier protein [Amycolatopsis sp. YIM 10]|uniref:acyl carrier protein n=1 Tax=Amycolatopsis sp. YIM 10 TaxID=2653857 RepID=UPI0012905356|nr:acyl carrier protein [Amycolatopsis sp. YIM 10]QFU89919.1 Actinorhodin polyketide synthase acyl carrier protein [Amycolatopsis sp. YIM 10]
MSHFGPVELQKIIDSCVGTDDNIRITEGNVDDKFADLGYDSLAVYEIATRVQDDLGIPVSDEQIDAMKTPRQLIEFVGESLAPAR